MELNVEQIIREYIDKSLHMSLATVRDNKPWVCEVHFAFDDDLNLYFRSTKARRHSMEIADNPFVSGNIVKQHAIDEVPHGVYFEGRAQLMENEQQYQNLYEIFKRRQDVTEAIIDDAKREDGPKFYKITVTDWYAFGKFGGDKMAKYHLPWRTQN